MNRTFNAAVAALLVTVGLAGPVAAQSQNHPTLEEVVVGVKMYTRGDYQDALRLLRPLAERGSGIAMQFIGLMYDFGQGVPQDYVTAHMWFNLAAAEGNENAVFFRDHLVPKMTRAQIAEAQKLAREWRPR
jgi:TPR repeat protein